MKRTFRSLIALAIAVVTLAACSSSDDAKYVADVSLPSGTEKTADADILVEAAAHEFTLNIQTEGEWKAEWIMGSVLLIIFQIK